MQGITVNAENGVVSIPGAAAGLSQTFTITAVAGTGYKGTIESSITITRGTLSLPFNPTYSAINARVGEAISDDQEVLSWPSIGDIYEGENRPLATYSPSTPLPNGLFFDNNGNIIGTPTGSGAFSLLITITATGENGRYTAGSNASASINIIIDP